MILKLLVVVAVGAALWLGSRYLKRLPSGRPPGSPSGPMSISQAAAILGIAPSSDPQTVREAHRRLIAANHPDRGGSDYLAQQINQARDILIQAERDRR